MLWIRPPPRERTDLRTDAVMARVRKRNRYAMRKIWSSGAGKIVEIMAAKCWYRVVIRKKSENVTEMNALRSRVARSRRPLSVSVSVKDPRETEARGMPGSLQIMRPMSEMTKRIGRAYQARSFLTGNRADTYRDMTTIYIADRMRRLRVSVMARTMKIRQPNFVHGLTREKNEACFSA
jgi:hypothetical protein